MKGDSFRYVTREGVLVFPSSRRCSWNVVLFYVFLHRQKCIIVICSILTEQRTSWPTAESKLYFLEGRGFSYVQNGHTDAGVHRSVQWLLYVLRRQAQKANHSPPELCLFFPRYGVVRY